MNACTHGGVELEDKFECHRCGKEFVTTTGKKGYFCGDCQRECEKELKQYSSELKQRLRRMGEELGFKTQTEFPHARSRIDLVWYMENDTLKERKVDKVIVAGFEIETSWRTRKHIRADIVNLRLLGAGMVVLFLPKKSFEFSGSTEESRLALRDYAKETASLLGMSNFYVWEEM